MEKYRSEATLIGTLTYASGYNAPSGIRCYGYDMKIRYQEIEGEYRLTVDTDQIVK